MSSSAVLTRGNLLVTPSRVTFNGVDLGGTKGPIAFSPQTKQTDIKVDQLGDSIFDKIVSGQDFSVKLTLSEFRNKANWKVAMPHAKLLTSGGNKGIYIDSQIGNKLSANAYVMILHPLILDDSDKSLDIKIYLAACESASEVKIGSGEESVLECIFRVLPDTTTSPARYLYFGDPAIAAVAATLTESSYSGTGNGTLTGETAGSAAVTETITATCVTAAADGGIFHVSGSVSGSLGLATVGVAFSSTKGGFTINDGATDFIVGDAFVLASVAANYV